MQTCWWIVLACIAVLAIPSHAQNKPQPSEDFSSAITSSLLNGTEHIVARGALYVNFGAKRKLDLDLDTGKQTLLDRFDQALRYTIVANTCLKEKTNSTPTALWGWLATATSTGKCALEDQNGQQWTSSEKEKTTIGCFQGDAPIQLVIVESNSTYMLVFTSFDQGKPDDRVFDPPTFCTNKLNLVP